MEVKWTGLFLWGCYVVFMPAFAKIIHEDHKFLASLSYKAKPYLKLGVVVHTCKPALKRQKDQEVRPNLDHIVGLRLAWAT